MLVVPGDSPCSPLPILPIPPVLVPSLILLLSDEERGAASGVAVVRKALRWWECSSGTGLGMEGVRYLDGVDAECGMGKLVLVPGW